MEITDTGMINDSSYSYRKASDKDAEKVRTIVFDALKSYGLPLDPSSTDRDLYEIAANYPEGWFWVIVDKEDHIYGSFALFHVESEIAEIRKMYFLPEMRGNGFGKWAMEFLIQKARQEGYKTISLETASVLKEAIGLYRRFGFQQSQGKMHSYRCDIKMELSL